MLIAADGRTWGGVSGGCLEREVARRGRIISETGRAELCRFDTTEELEETGGARSAALGCAGLIDIFIEPIDAHRPGPMPLLRRVCQQRIELNVATILRSELDPTRVGLRLTDADAPAEIAEHLADASGLRVIEGETVFFERFTPPQSLVIFGGGPDGVPVVELARTLGWHVTVIASHGGVGYRERFAAANVVALGTHRDPLGGVPIESGAAVVLMTHNYERDLRILEAILPMPRRYMGILGPRRRAERLMEELGSSLEEIYAPVGLDIGATTPETIALSIVSEIQAVLTGHDCRSLRDRGGPIYEHEAGEAAGVYRVSSCPLSP